MNRVLHIIIDWLLSSTHSLRLLIGCTRHVLALSATNCLKVAWRLINPIDQIQFLYSDRLDSHFLMCSLSLAHWLDVFSLMSVRSFFLRPVLSGLLYAVCGCLPRDRGNRIVAILVSTSRFEVLIAQSVFRSNGGVATCWRSMHASVDPASADCWIHYIHYTAISYTWITI